MADVRRISPPEARERVRIGTALLVCAYEDETLCRKNWLEGAMSLQQFKSRLPSLALQQEVIFYCA